MTPIFTVNDDDVTTPIMTVNDDADANANLHRQRDFVFVQISIFYILDWAIYVDSNSSMDISWKVVKSLLEPIITPATLQTHPVTKFYELCQKHAFEVRFVDLWKETGAIDVFVDNEFVARGICSSKKFIALSRAANNAYNEIVRKLSAESNNEDQ